MKKYQIRYHSEMINGMALFDEYTDIAEAKKASFWLARSFFNHGLHREAKSVEIR